jgi:L-amino acid N-acyltransferase YncA
MRVAGLLVRPQQPGDIAQIAAIYAHAVLHGTATFELDPPSLPEMTERSEALRSGGYPYIVAELGGEVMGYAYAGAYRPRPAYRATVESSVYVRDDMHGQGIGRALLHDLVGEAARRGFRQMVAVIGDSENIASIRLHQCAGFQLTGTFQSVGWKHGRWLDTVLMQRALGAGSAEPFG